MSSAAAAIAGSTLVSAYMQNKAADKRARSAKNAAQARVKAAEIAAEQREEANKRNIELQRELFKQQRKDMKPWREVGEEALGELRQGVQEGRYTPGRFDFEFQESPGYQFRKNEALDAIESRAAAQGRLQSGATMKALVDRASNMAAQEYGNAFQRSVQRYNLESGRRSNQFNQMASLADVGQTANQQIQEARSNLASRVGQSTRAMGQAAAQGTQRAGNAAAQGMRQAGQARASGYTGMARSVNQGIQNYLLYSKLG